MNERVKVRATLHVTGTVQGVFFRAETARVANELGLSGYVRNNGDGSVTIVAIGIKSQIQALIEWCTHGKKRAKVDKVDVQWESPSIADGGSFEIREE